MSFRPLFLLLITALSFWSCKELCQDPYADNFEKKGSCEFPVPAKPKFTFFVTGTTFNYDNDPTKGGLWNGICSDWNSNGFTTTQSWMKFDWRGQSWNFEIEFPRSREFSAATGQGYQITTPTPCPNAVLNASAKMYVWNEGDSNYDKLATTSQDNSGTMILSEVFDGRFYGQPSYYYISGSFSFSIEIDDLPYRVQGSFEDNPILKTWN